ncbi:MAG: D-alanyl-D-alanine carboxypeptidase [Candidatus Yanofskybacteria bacterium]|nr:D-alanyl-D-alanine carboxypeptidase [Candidatus Yanofskybacteria bacterium]
MRRVLLIPILILAGLAVFSFSVRPSPKPSTSPFIVGATPAIRSAQAFLLPAANPGYAPVRDTNVPEPVLDANAALLVHLDSGKVLYEKRSSLQMPIASLTKLLSALVATDLFDANEVVTVASGSVRVDGQKQTLYEGERLMVRDLLSMMLVESSNDAAYALAAYARERQIDFVSEMNRRAYTLGMESCAFKDPAGLDDTATCDANDLLRLVRAVMRQAPSLLPITTHSQLEIRSADGKMLHEVKNTNELLGTISGVLGGKTGYTDGALGCLILVVKLPGKSDTLVSIVLGSRARFTDTQALVAWAERGYQWQ